MNIHSGTICAPIHQAGSAICIIRISGPESIKICSTIFHPMNSERRLTLLKGFTVVFGLIKDADIVIDEVLVTLFKAPHSYTGEDMVEISCHGSAHIIRSVTNLLIKGGAVAAGAGEFTRRAFINGKMDLSQAEAVADLIASESAAAHKLAMQQLRGGFSNEIRLLRESLLHFASLIELELDFGEEDVEFADRSDLISLVTEVRNLSKGMAASFSLGNAIKKGIPVAIVGRPNSGKSTLLNTLLKEERSIVSEVPGTTRDYIEDTVNIGSLLFRFIDTAGIRKSEDIIENLGISRSFAKIDEATIVILVHDAIATISELDHSLQEIRGKMGGDGKKLFVAINKIDLASPDLVEVYKQYPILENERLVLISAKSGAGISLFLEELPGYIETKIDKMPDIMVTNARHFQSLIGVSESLTRVMDVFNEGMPSDLAAIDIRHAIHHLGEITGEITNDEVLGNIFKNFCIGK